MIGYIIKPLSPFHIGEDIADEVSGGQFPRSDTLASALALCWEQLFGVSPIEIFTNSKFCISSAMPWIRTGKPDGIRLFLPMRRDFEYPPQSDGYKKIKKLKWVEKPLWQKMIVDRKFLSGIANLSDCVAGEILLSTPCEKNEFFAVGVRQRVTVDRASSTSDTFFSGENYFARASGSAKVESGFWILADFSGDLSGEVRRQFEASLRLLGDTGIGADRSSGKGFFEIAEVLEEKELGLPYAENPDGVMLLSLWSPAADELLALRDERSRWSVEIRGGWIAPGYGVSFMKRPIMMFSEGSVVAGKIAGKVVDVTPGDEVEKALGHKVCRWGKAMTLPIKLTAREEKR